MFYVGIDLAERHSAAVVLDRLGAVIHETTLDAGQQEKPPNPWKNIDAVREWFVGDILKVLREEPREGREFYVIETPHFHARNGEAALMVQGGLMCVMREWGAGPSPRILAMEWQNYFGYSKKEHGDSKAWAAEYARVYYDYEPGQTWEPGTRMVKKMREDLIDAFLLARWLFEKEETALAK